MIVENNWLSNIGTLVSGVDKKALLKDADFDFGITDSPVFFWSDKDCKLKPFNNRKAIVRKDSGVALGLVKERYSAVDMKEALCLLDPFVEEGHLAYEYAGTSYSRVGEGLQFWAMMKLNEEYYEVVKDDKILPYLLISNSFDGSAGLSIRSTGIRLQCNNQMYLLLKEGGDKFTIKHTGLARKRFLKGGRQWLEKLLINNQKTIDLYQKMNNTEISFSKFNEYLHKIFPDQLKEGKDWKWVSTLAARYARGDQFANQNTLYSAYNAITELLTHDIGKTEESRFYNYHWGSNSAYSKRAFLLAKQMLE